MSKDSLRNLVGLSGEFVGTTDAQILTNKTVNSQLNTIIQTTPAAGSLLKDNGTSFVPLARGSAGLPLRVNDAGTDVGYTALGVAGGGTGATTLTGVLIGAGTSAITTKVNPAGNFLDDSSTQNIVGAKTFSDTALKLRNPAGTFTGTIRNPVLTANADIELNYNLYTYVIWKSGSTYYAKSGQNGAMLTSNATFSTVAQAAIDACSDGDSVAILPGTYTRTVQLNILKNNFTLIGIGKVSLVSSGHINGIVVGDGTTQYEGVRIENIGIDMGDFEIVSNDCHCIWLKKCNNFVVTRCDLGNRGTPTHGVRACCVRIIDSLYGEVSFNHCHDYINGIVVDTTTSSDIRIIGNNVHDIDPYDCIVVYRTSGGKCSITGNVCYNGFFSGVLLEGGSGVTDEGCTVSGNACHDVQYGVFVYGGQKATITGNNLYNCTNYGINVRTSTPGELTISGNNVHNATNAGIHIGDTSQRGTITANNVSGCLHGIHIESTSHYWNITGNSLHFNDRNGLLIDGSSDINVTGNTISENSQETNNAYSEVLLQNTATKCQFIGNKFPISSATTNKSKYGIEEASTTEASNFYQSNYFSTLHATGKLLISSTTSKAYDNQGVSDDVQKTGAYTVTALDKIIRVDGSSSAFTLTLPTAVGIAGREYHIFRTDITQTSNVITLDPAGSETIDGAAAHYLYAGEWIKIESDGANWVVIGRTSPSSRGYFRKGSSANRRIVAGALPNLTGLTPSTTSPAANTLWALPLVVENTIKFDTIGFRCSTLSTAGSARAGIYRDDGNMYPGALIFDTGAIDTSTGSTSVPRDTTITSALQVFQPGVYWLVWETNSATGQYHTLNGGTAVISFTGNDPSMGSTGSTFGYSVTHTFGSLPDPYTAGGTLLTTAPAAATPIVAVGLRPV